MNNYIFKIKPVLFHNNNTILQELLNKFLNPSYNFEVISGFQYKFTYGLTLAIIKHPLVL